MEERIGTGRWEGERVKTLSVYVTLLLANHEARVWVNFQFCKMIVILGAKLLYNGHIKALVQGKIHSKFTLTFISALNKQ